MGRDVGEPSGVLAAVKIAVPDGRPGHHSAVNARARGCADARRG